MRTSYVIGAFLGILLTAGLWYGAKAYKIILPAKPAEQRTGLSDAEDLPIARPDEGFERPQTGEDLLAHRSQIAPFITLDDWDRSLADMKDHSLKRGSACDFAETQAAIALPPEQTKAIMAGKINVLFLDRAIPSCFEESQKVVLLVDNLMSASRLYDIAGEIVIDRIFEHEVAQLPETLLIGMKVAKADVPYLMNTEIAPNRRYTDATLLHVSPTGYRPLLDATEVPPFYPGVRVLKAKSITSYFKNFHSGAKPVFVDGRELRASQNSASYPGAVSAAFHSTQPVQLKFQPELSVSISKGASFDMKALPIDHQTPLLIFGEDATDASPLWLLRHLRLHGYRTLFFIRGGLKELKEVQPVIQF